MPLLKVKNFPNRSFAEMASETLEREGIVSWIRSPDIGISAASGWPVPQGADLYVDAEDAVRAAEIVSTLFGDV